MKVLSSLLLIAAIMVATVTIIARQSGLDLSQATGHVATETPTIEPTSVKDDPNWIATRVASDPTSITDPYPPLVTVTPNATRVLLSASAIAATDVAEEESSRRWNQLAPTPLPLILHVACDVPSDVSLVPDVGIVFEDPSVPGVLGRFRARITVREERRLMINAPAVSIADALTLIPCLPQR
ncbi:MAG: hypothetical protein IPJ58_05120 [Ardenticatenia bacterium]|nr:hypothetical protein [Ardenticatenia bacterium]